MYGFSQATGMVFDTQVLPRELDLLSLSFQDAKPACITLYRGWLELIPQVTVGMVLIGAISILSAAPSSASHKSSAPSSPPISSRPSSPVGETRARRPRQRQPTHKPSSSRCSSRQNRASQYSCLAEKHAGNFIAPVGLGWRCLLQNSSVCNIHAAQFDYRQLI
jgi:hypothetical protein